MDFCVSQIAEDAANDANLDLYNSVISQDFIDNQEEPYVNALSPQVASGSFTAAMLDGGNEDAAYEVSQLVMLLRRFAGGNQQLRMILDNPPASTQALVEMANALPVIASRLAPPDQRSMFPTMMQPERFINACIALVRSVILAYNPELSQTLGPLKDAEQLSYIFFMYNGSTILCVTDQPEYMKGDTYKEVTKEVQNVLVEAYLKCNGSGVLRPERNCNVNSDKDNKEKEHIRCVASEARAVFLDEIRPLEMEYDHTKEPVDFNPIQTVMRQVKFITPGEVKPTPNQTMFNENGGERDKPKVPKEITFFVADFPGEEVDAVVTSVIMQKMLEKHKRHTLNIIPDETATTTTTASSKRHKSGPRG